MDLHLQNKVAIVTGAGRGIGLAIATALAQEGAAVVAQAAQMNSMTIGRMIGKRLTYKVLTHG